MASPEAKLGTEKEKKRKGEREPAWEEEEEEEEGDGVAREGLGSSAMSL